ncbi:hypothetical protein [Streptosporangium sp. NPDC049644]|uniref:hypothetical protein n=1 Tax=Streptosporangium sp. NPDC049644 TaxID=3155507 RepID=UPI00343CABC7
MSESSSGGKATGRDPATGRAHHDAAGTHLGQDVITALEKAAGEEKARRRRPARIHVLDPVINGR